MQRTRRGVLAGSVSLAAAIALAAPLEASADRFQYRSQTITSPKALIKFKATQCNSGPVVGGGLASSSTDLWLIASNTTTKVPEVDLPRNAWLGVVVNTSLTTDRQLTVTSICETSGNDEFVYRTEKFRGPGMQETIGKVSCRGMPLVGGGVYPIDPDAQLANLSAPTASGKGWRGGAWNGDNKRHDVRVTAICQKTGGDRFVSHTRSVTLNPFVANSVQVGCGQNGRLVGGGFIATEAPIDMRLHSSTPTSNNRAWRVSGTNFDTGVTHPISTVSMCER